MKKFLAVTVFVAVVYSVAVSTGSSIYVSAYPTGKSLMSGYVYVPPESTIRDISGHRIMTAAVKDDFFIEK